MSNSGKIPKLVYNLSEFGVFLHQLNELIMARQSISLTEPNDQWLQERVGQQGLHQQEWAG